MKSFDQLLTHEIAAYEGRHEDLIYQAPVFYRLMVNLLDDPRLPERMRPMVLSTIAYFILPVDIIPEDIEGPYGYVDDIFLCALTARHISHELQLDAILTENWDGECPVLPLIEDVLTREKELIGEQRWKMLKYIGM